MMITHSSAARLQRGYASRVLVLPLLLLLFSAFTIKVTMPGMRGNAAVLRANQPAVVVIDAGHGGIDPGAHDKNLLEKDIALSLAQKINELAGQYHVQVVMTRNSDQLPGNYSDIRDGLKKRVAIASEKNAALFVSLHVNADGDHDFAFPGFEAYIAGRKEDKRAALLATDLLQQLSPLYNTSPTIKQRTEKGVWVLDKSPCPAVLLECGNIGNPGDMRFMTDPVTQEKVARGILEGIVKYLGGNP